MYRKNLVSMLFLRARHGETIKLLDGRSPKRILDVGCDDGQFLKMLSERFPSAALSGCDMEAGALEEAREACPQAELHDGDFMELELGMHDLVVMLEILEHSVNPGAMLGKAASLIGREGRLLVSTPRSELQVWRILWALWSSTFGRRWQGQHHDLSEAELIALAAGHGLRPERRARFFFGCITMILFKPSSATHS